MPARTAASGAAANAASSAPAGKTFELPALDFNFSSLTEGTDIPPPEPSPVQPEVPTPPKTPKPTDTQQAEANGNQVASPTSNPDTVATKRSHDDPPVSPVLSSHGSIRRLISKSLLNGPHADGETASINGNGDAASRPDSRATSVGGDTKRSKRTSGFFRRLRSNESKRPASMIIEQKPVTPPKKPKGPPPPMIPELGDLEAKINLKDEGSLGSDLFKNIN